MTGAPPRSSWLRKTLTVVFTVVAGPPIGGLLFALFAAGRDVAAEGLSGDALKLVGLAPVISLLGYTFGLIPAVIGGALFVVADALAPPRAPRLALAPLIGAAATALFSAIVLARTAGKDLAPAVIGLAALGAASGFVCAWIGQRIGLLRRMPAAGDRAAAKSGA